MPKVNLTEDELAFLSSERERIRLDNLDWNKRASVDDKELLEMSPHVVERVFTSRPEIWIRSDREFRMRNILHPENHAWYMEYLAGLVTNGELSPEDVHTKLALLPVYSTQDGGKPWMSS